MTDLHPCKTFSAGIWAGPVIRSSSGVKFDLLNLGCDLIWRMENVTWIDDFLGNTL